jgi:hypothetical protein
MPRKNRTQIPKDIAASILYQTNRTCCVCHQENKPVQIHHIDENPSNNDIANLTALCLDCHNETQKSGGFDRKLDPAQIKLYRDDWIKTMAEYRNRFREEMIKSKLKIQQKTEITPIEIPESKFSDLDKEIRELIKKIGKYKISDLLQEAKLIAIDTNDKEMQNWIDLELKGYDATKNRIQHEKAKKIFSEYRFINVKFFLQASNHSITQEVNYPIWLMHSMTSIEEYLQKYKKDNIMMTIKIELPKKMPRLSSQTVNALLPELELERIVHGAERKLSQYLESKLIL